MGEVRYGTAGWNFADWYGPFYPSPKKDDGPGALFTGVLDEAPDPDVRLAKRKPLAYYARFFDAVEVNSSFYGIPTAKTTAAWAELTEDVGTKPFLFSLKLPMPFTHEGLLEPREVEAFRDCLAPIRERGRLGALLAQFPHQFPNAPFARERLARIKDAFADMPLAVEVRHKTWDHEQGRALLADLEVSLANIDQPQNATTLPPASAVTSTRLAYVRLHGRNAKAWSDAKAGRDAKYDYLYDPTELREWASRIDVLSGLADTTLVIANNHFRGKAPANALELRVMREGLASKSAFPQPLLSTYPQLSRFADAV